MRNLNEIIVHCTATQPHFMAGRPLADKVAEIKRWHVSDNGWRDIGYHFLIDRNGDIANGRPLAQSGAHTRGRNKGSIGIALFGGHGSSETDNFDDNFTPEQGASLRNLIASLQSEHGQMAVNGHNQYAAKACPGFSVPDWLKTKRTSKRYLPPEAERVLEDADKAPVTSTTNWAVFAGFASSGWAAFQSADPMVQGAALIVVAVLAYIWRERLRKAKLGKIAKRVMDL